MRKKISGIVGAIFGLISFLLVLGGVGRMEVGSSPDSFVEGLLVALLGLGIFILLAIGLFFHNRFELPPSIPKWEKERRKRLGLLL